MSLSRKIISKIIFFVSTSLFFKAFHDFLLTNHAEKRILDADMANQCSIQLSDTEAAALEKKLEQTAGFSRSERQYASFCFEKEDVNVAFFPKRKKLLVQGKGTNDFVEFVLLLNPTETAPAKSQTLPALVDTTPHFGIDESGKGDYFGPLVIAGVYSNEHLAPLLTKLGCKDSKQIPDDKHICAIADKIKTLPGIVYEIVCIGPARYNEIYADMANLNKLLAWGHARVIAALHEKMPSCPRALSDQFANEWVLKTALKKRNIPVQLDQRPRAESDVAVAAASILARARFVQWMQQTAQAAQCDIPLGCSPKVVKAAQAFVQRHGAARLKDVAKLHFKVTQKIIPNVQ